MEALVEVKGATKTFVSDGAEFQALKGVDVSIGKGEFMALTGESGSGKSTLLSVLGGIAPPTTGTLTVDGIDVYALPIERQADFRREYVGFVFQQFHLLQYLTAVENVQLPLVVSPGSNSAKKRQAALEALDQVGLSGKADRLPSQMSGGEQQRVAIARALVNRPPLILADEPTGNLDSKTGEGIFSLLRDLNGSGQTIVIVTHNPELAERTGRVLKMKDGLLI